MCIKCEVANGFNPDAGAKFQPGDLASTTTKYRIGKKQKRVVLDEDGLVVVEFPIGSEKLAAEYCEFKNMPTIIFRESKTRGVTYPSWGEGLSTEYLKGGGDLATITKPSIGLIPRKFHEENRITALMEAINRNLSDGRLIPEEWHDELNDLLYNRVERKVEA